VVSFLVPEQTLSDRASTLRGSARSGPHPSRRDSYFADRAGIEVGDKLDLTLVTPDQSRTVTEPVGGQDRTFAGGGDRRDSRVGRGRAEPRSLLLQDFAACEHERRSPPATSARASRPRPGARLGFSFLRARSASSRLRGRR
jgi:hypothetical protein